METLLFNPTIAAAGVFILLAVAVGAILLSYIAEEEFKGRQFAGALWPLCVREAEEPIPAEEVKTRKAA